MVAPLHCKQGILSHKMFDSKLESKLAVFNGEPHADFRLWQLRVEAALRGKEVIAALTDENANQSTKEQATTMLVAVFGNSPSMRCRVVQDQRKCGLSCRTVMQREPSIKKYSVLFNFPNMRYNGKTNMANHIVNLESQCKRLETMRLMLKDSFEVTIFISSLQE